jgi:hypothetical protein
MGAVACLSFLGGIPALADGVGNVGHFIPAPLDILAGDLTASENFNQLELLNQDHVEIDRGKLWFHVPSANSHTQAVIIRLNLGDIVFPLHNGRLKGDIAQVPLVSSAALQESVNELEDRRYAGGDYGRDEADTPQKFVKGVSVDVHALDWYGARVAVVYGVSVGVIFGLISLGIQCLLAKS